MLKQVLKFAIKDFEIQKKSVFNYFILGLLLTVIFSLANFSDRQMIFSLMVFVIVYGFVNKALYEDEKNNTLRLIVSLPVKRETIVYARYLSVGVMAAFTACLFFVLSNVLTDGANESSAAGLLVSGATILVFIIMLSIYLPLAFKLGYIKAAGINRFLMIGIFAFFGAGAVAVEGLLKNNPPAFIVNLDAFLSSLDLSLIIAAALAAVLLVYIGSMRLSAAIFRKRELF